LVIFFAASRLGVNQRKVGRTRSKSNASPGAFSILNTEKDRLNFSSGGLVIFFAASRLRVNQK